MLDVRDEPRRAVLDERGGELEPRERQERRQDERLRPGG